MFSDYTSIFSNKNFILLWISQFFSQVTINILNFVLLFKLFEVTGSTLATSMLWVAYALPAILIGPIASASADLFDRRKVLMLTNLFQTMTILFYAFFNPVSIYLLYGFSFMYSFINQFYVPAELAMLPSILKKRALAQSNGLFFITQQASIIIGFGAAGVLKEYLELSQTLYICSFLVFLAFISVLGLPKTKMVKGVSHKLEEALRSFFVTIAKGYSYIKNNNSILAPLSLMLFLHISMTIIIVNVPAIASEIFEIPVKLSGLIMAMPAGIGAIIGSILVPRFLRRGGRKIKMIELSILTAVLSLFLMLFLLPEVFGLVKFLTEITLVVLLGFSFIGILIPSQTFLQENIPSDLRGRVFGNFWFIATALSVMPVIFSGTFSEIFGIRIFLFIITAIAFAILLFIKKYGDEFIREGFSLKRLRF